MSRVSEQQIELYRQMHQELQDIGSAIEDEFVEYAKLTGIRSGYRYRLTGSLGDSFELDGHQDWRTMPIRFITDRAAWQAEHADELAAEERRLAELEEFQRQAKRERLLREAAELGLTLTCDTTHTRKD